jgi:aminopeptidase N
VRRRLVTSLLAATLVAVACTDDGGLLPASTTTADGSGEVATPTTLTTPTTPTTSTTSDGLGVAGAPGLGDPYFPTLGNGGYDVDRYHLDLTVDGADIVASVIIEATASAALDTFNLDFATFAIDGLDVNGEPASHRFDGDELVVDPDPVLAAGDAFTVDVRYRGRPPSVENDVLGTLGWQTLGGVTFVSDEPNGAHTWFPSNDHPADKASFRVTMTVPRDTVAVASGVLVSRRDDGARSTWVWEHSEPIATYVLALAIGPLTLVESDGPHGIHIRHAFAPRLADRATAVFAGTADMITDLEEMFGPYPFDSYGALVIDGELGYAMETQTLSLFPASILDGSRFSRLTIVHELAHHWFGNWVSPASWNETWLNEGFATYAEQLWLEHTTPGYDIDGAMQTIAADGQYGPIGDPGVSGMFAPAVYRRGALTLHALRHTMGDAAFFRLLRAWPDRFGGTTATTDDLADLASEIAGDDLDPFFAEWVDAPKMPALPG